MYAVIGNTNRSNEPCLFCFDECTPGAIAGLLTTIRGMDEVSNKIKVLDAKDSTNILSKFKYSVSLHGLFRSLSIISTDWGAIETGLSS